MENIFKIFCYSKFRFTLIVFLPIIILPILVTIVKNTIGGVWEYVVGIIIIGLVIYSWFKSPKYFAKSVLQITIIPEGIIISSVKPFYGFKNSEDNLVRFDDIKTYKYEVSNNFSVFKINLKNGKKIVINRWYNDSNDEFDKFFTFFERKIKSYNKSNPWSLIVKKKLLMEDKRFLKVLAFILLTVILFSLFLIFKFGIRNFSGLLFLFISLPSLIWIIITINKNR